MLGTCETFAEAKSIYLELVAPHPPAATDLLILSESGKEMTVPWSELVAALEAAVD